MALTTTNALIQIIDQAGATQALAAGTSGLYTPGGTLNFQLQSTTGVQRWDLTFICPSFAGLHQKTFNWLQGMNNNWAVPMPDQGAVGTNVLSGLQVVSVVSDGVQSIATTYNFLAARGGGAVPMQHFVRGVIVAALPAYTNVNGVLTGNAVGAVTSGMADGLTLVPGDLVLLPPGIAASAADAGLYQVTLTGSASVKFIFTAAPDAPIGAIMLPKTEFLVSEGTVFNGTTWVNTLTGLTNVIGTASFTFYPRQVVQSVTLVAGTKTIATIPIISATATSITFSRTTANTSTATTGGYQPSVSGTPGPVAGALGTASIVVSANAAAGTLNNADISTLAMTVTNPC